MRRSSKFRGKFTAPPLRLTPAGWLRRSLRVVAGTMLCALLASSGEAESKQGGPGKLEEVRRLLAGDFSSANQARANKDFFEIHLHLREIWTSRTDGPWLYVEQATATAQDKPYRQRIYQLVLRPDGRVESRVFTFAEPLRFAGAWRETARLDALSPADLKLREGCSVILERAADGTYSGATADKTCPSELRGAAYATSVVTLSAGQFVSWDRGFDASDKQVWGATSGGYIFERTKDAKP